MATNSIARSHEYSNQSNQRQQINVNDTERLISGVSGAALALYGIKHGGISGVLLTALGGGLAYRGVSGHCQVYQALGINSAESQNSQAGVRSSHAISVEKSITIHKPVAELFQFWSNFENLPRVMSHLESVQIQDAKKSHWKAKAVAGITFEWDAEVINEKENELIAWQSLENSEVKNAGSVRFEKAPDGQETVVRVNLSYESPGGQIGVWLAKLFGGEPGQVIEEDLRKFKQLMETGETASTTGQPSGRKSASGR